MKKDLIFFASDGKGLTSTSANHIANMAKEMIRTLETELQGMVFYSTEVALIGNDNINTLSIGSDDSTVKATADKLFRIARAKSLIAWLREAIKAKERLIKETEALTIQDFAKSAGIEIPEAPKYSEPLTEDEYYASLSLQERNRYYELETLAAVLGKEIHPGGSFADARDNLARRMANPHDVKGDGRDTLIYSYRPTVSADVVESVYFDLQKLYREAQAKLNAIKYECEKAVREAGIRAQTEFTKATEAWNARMEDIRNRRAEYIRKKTKEYGDMKITIPYSLDGIYTEVSRLGKEGEDNQQSKEDQPS